MKIPGMVIAAGLYYILSWGTYDKKISSAILPFDPKRDIIYGDRAEEVHGSRN